MTQNPNRMPLSAVTNVKAGHYHIPKSKIPCSNYDLIDL